jgi:HSP20 family molecular chaperone IbpA
MDNPVEFPVNLSEMENELVLHAPLPGTEPEDIVIALAPGPLTIKSTPRGTLQEGAKRHLHEWQIGAYERTITLPREISSE